ncbi:hypothetical protein A5N83_03110 [Rhodococcus sp. 1139]|nr:hypothetical protein A5N83_03110 [Rhodococcus sp. 1139]
MSLPLLISDLSSERVEWRGSAASRQVGGFGMCAIARGDGAQRVSGACARDMFSVSRRRTGVSEVVQVGTHNRAGCSEAALCGGEVSDDVLILGFDSEELLDVRGRGRPVVQSPEYCAGITDLGTRFLQRIEHRRQLLTRCNVLVINGRVFWLIAPDVDSSNLIFRYVNMMQTQGI